MTKFYIYFFYLKKAIDGDLSYFEYWADEINDENILNKFKENELKSRKMSLLHYAAQHCHPAICEILIKKFNFDPNIRASKDLTPLHVLVRFNSRMKHEQKNFDELNNSIISTSTPSNSPRNSRKIVELI